MKKTFVITLLTYLVLTLFSCNEKPKQEERKSISAHKNKQKTEMDLFLDKKSKKESLSAEDKWKQKVEKLNKMKEGESYTTIIKPLQNKKSKLTDGDWLDLNNYKGSKNNIEFENNEYWRKEAFKVSLKYIQKSIGKIKNCKVIRQGIYQHQLIRYIGNRGFLVKSYCEFDCKQNYNNPTYFWVEVYYQGNNFWKGEIVKQKFVD